MTYSSSKVLPFDLPCTELPFQKLSHDQEWQGKREETSAIKKLATRRNKCHQSENFHFLIFHVFALLNTILFIRDLIKMCQLIHFTRVQECIIITLQLRLKCNIAQSYTVKDVLFNT